MVALAEFEREHTIMDRVMLTEDKARNLATHWGVTESWG
jgi:hypothetical protein